MPFPSVRTALTPIDVLAEVGNSKPCGYPLLFSLFSRIDRGSRAQKLMLGLGARNIKHCGPPGMLRGLAD